MSTTKGVTEPPPTADEQKQIPRNKFIKITEVALRYKVGKTGYQLSLDPGKVNWVFWDDASYQRYQAGLKSMRINLGKATIFDLTGTTIPLLQPTTPATVYSFGVRSKIRCQLKNGRYYESKDKCVTSEVIVRYQSLGSGTHYELRLVPCSYATKIGKSDLNKKPREITLHPPARSGDYELGEEGGLHENYIESGVHALFWNADASTAYRTGLDLEPNLQLKRMRHVGLDGRYHHPHVRKFTHAIYRPVFPARPGAFSSEVASLCYHFEDCEWVCTTE